MGGEQTGTWVQGIQNILYKVYNGTKGTVDNYKGLTPHFRHNQIVQSINKRTLIGTQNPSTDR